jgi:hypothetical protein
MKYNSIMRLISWTHFRGSKTITVMKRCVSGLTKNDDTYFPFHQLFFHVRQTLVVGWLEDWWVWVGGIGCAFFFCPLVRNLHKLL